MKNGSIESLEPGDRVTIVSRCTFARVPTGSAPTPEQLVTGAPLELWAGDVATLVMWLNRKRHAVLRLRDNVYFVASTKRLTPSAEPASATLPPTLDVEEVDL